AAGRSLGVGSRRRVEMESASERVVTYRYAVRDGQGAQVEGSPPDDARCSLIGRGAEHPEVAARLAQASAGDHLAFTLLAAQAFGERDPALVHEVPRSHWQAAEPVLGPVELQVRAESGEVVVLSGRVVAFDA